MNHYVAGKNAVYECLKAGRRRVFRVFVDRKNSDETVKKILTLAAQKKVPVEMTLSPQIVQQASVQTHQGIIAETAPFEYTPLHDLLKTATADSRGGFLLLCDEIQDPHNFGALLRTAYLLGVHGVVTLKHRSVEVTPAVAKAAAGSVEYLPVVKEANLINVIQLLKEKEYFVYGASMGGGQSLYQTPFSGSVALVLGGEGKGLRDSTIKYCDITVFIPMQGALDSLNVSVAGGILMGEIARQRGISKNRL